MAVVREVTEAMVHEAHDAWDAGRLKDAFRLFTRNAEAGSIHAMLNLGYFHDAGIGTRVDKAEALRWYKRAHRLGEMAAAANIATVYQEMGNLRLMVAWYRRAIDMHDDDACVDLAKCLLDGIGVRRSFEEAVRLLRRAAASDRITPAGREEAQAMLAACGLPGGVH